MSTGTQRSPGEVPLGDPRRRRPRSIVQARRVRRRVRFSSSLLPFPGRTGGRPQWNPDPETARRRPVCGRDRNAQRGRRTLLHRPAGTAAATRMPVPGACFSVFRGPAQAEHTVTRPATDRNHPDCFRRQARAGPRPGTTIRRTQIGGARSALRRQDSGGACPLLATPGSACHPMPQPCIGMRSGVWTETGAARLSTICDA